ncbi:unnamed protein product, partial [Closterium sp. NIES-53]
FPDATEIPRWGDLSRAGVAIFDLDYDVILAAMHALSTSDEGDCYLCVPPDPGIEAAALGAGETAALGASASAALGAGESAPSGTASAQVLHTFTLDSGASCSFFRDRTTRTPLSRPVAVSLADPSGGPVLASFSTVLPCPAAPSASLSGLYLPSFSTNLVSGADLQDQGVDQFTPASQRVTHCTCARTGRHLATFTRRPGSSLYTLSTASPPVPASSQVFAAASGSGPESAPYSCRLLSHQTLLWHHRLGHPSLPRLRGMASRVLVSGLPRSLPPLPLGPAPTCVPCVEGRQHAAPHSSEFPPTEAPLQTLHMDVWGPARVRGQGHERYFLLVVDDYSRYTTVFPLRSKGEVTEVLIDWIRAARLRLRESFGSDFPVLRLHSDRGGEFSSARLGAFCRAQGIRQTFTLPASPQQNGIAERRIGMVMDVARHADASWADDQATQRSSQGYSFSLGSDSVSWRSTRSSSVLSSSCEAEIYAGAMAAQELRWLTYLLTDLGEQPRSPPILYVDNKAMLAFCREHRLEHRTKHIALRYFLARKLQQRGQLRLAYVASEANTADIFTKALPPGDYQRFCTMLACFALLDWSCDLLFSPTLPMGAKVDNEGQPCAGKATADHRVLTSVSRASAPSSRPTRHAAGSGGDRDAMGGGAAVQSASGASGGRGVRGTGSGLVADDGGESVNLREGGGAAGVVGSAPISRRRMRLRQGEAMRRRGSDTWGWVLSGLAAWCPGRSRPGARLGAFGRSSAGAGSNKLQGSRRQAKSAQGLPLPLRLFLATAAALAVVAGSARLMQGDDALPARPLLHLLPDARARSLASSASPESAGGGGSRNDSNGGGGGVAGAGTGVEGEGAGGGIGEQEGEGSNGPDGEGRWDVGAAGGGGDGGTSMGGDAGWEEDEEEGSEESEGARREGGSAGESGGGRGERDVADGLGRDDESVAEGEGASEGEAAVVRGLGGWAGPFDSIEDEAVVAHGLSAFGMRTPPPASPSSRAAVRQCRQGDEFRAAVEGRSVLVVLHEASLTGAPLAGMELAEEVALCTHPAPAPHPRLLPRKAATLVPQRRRLLGSEGEGGRERVAREGCNATCSDARLNLRRLLGRVVEEGAQRAGGRGRRGSRGGTAHKGQRAQQRQQRLEQQKLRRRQRRQQLQQRQMAAAEQAGMVVGGAGVHVLLLNRKGGLLPELQRRGLSVLKSKGSDSWRAAIAAHVVIASSATAASWIGESTAPPACMPLHSCEPVSGTQHKHVWPAACTLAAVGLHCSALTPRALRLASLLPSPAGAYLATCSIGSSGKSSSGDGSGDEGTAGTDRSTATDASLPVAGHAGGVNACGQRLVWWLMENRREYFDQAKPLLPRVSTLIFISHSQAATWRAWAAAEGLQLPDKQHVIPLSINAELAVMAGLAPLLPPSPLPLPTLTTSAEAAAAGQGMGEGRGEGEGNGAADLAGASAAARAQMRQRVRARIGARRGDMVVLCLSSVNPGKGQLGLLQAALQVWASRGELGMAGGGLTAQGRAGEVGSEEDGQGEEGSGRGEAVMVADVQRRRALALPLAHPAPQQRWHGRRLIVVVGAMNGKSNKGEYIVRMAEAVRERMGHAHVAAQVKAGGIVWVNATLKVAPLYAAADAYVMNAQGIGETFGRVTVEAMAFQLPVLGTAVGGTAEIVRHNVTGLLHPVRFKGVPLLARHLALLLRRPSLRRQMGMRGREEVRQRFLSHLMFAHMGKVIGDALRAADASQHVGKTQSGAL